MARKRKGRERLNPLSEQTLQRIDEAWDALEKGDVEIAGEEAEKLMEETEGHPEVCFLLGAALLESGFPGEALEQLESSDGKVDSPIVHSFYLASTMLELARFEEAERHFRQVLDVEKDKAPVYYGLAQTLEHLGRYTEAETFYESAYRDDGACYPLPTRMQRDAFERVVNDARELLPPELLAHLKEVPIIVQDLPERDVLKDEESEAITPSVLGLFVGRSMREQSVFNPPDLPPTIFIYQRNLERVCQTRDELVHEINLTLYHELGHYIGLEEEDLEARGLE